MRQIALLAAVVFVVGCGKEKPAAPVTSSNSTIGPVIPKSVGEPAVPEENYKTIQPRATFQVREWANDSFLNRLLLSADGNRLAVALFSEKTQIWDLTGEPKKVKEVSGMAAALSPDGKRFVRSGKASGYTTEVADADTGAKMSTLEYTGVLLGQCFFPSAGEVIIAHQGTNEREEKDRKPNSLIVRTYDVASGKVTASFDIPNYVNGTHFTQFGLNGGKNLAVANQKTGHVEFWDIPEKKIVREISVAKEPLKYQSDFAVSTDAKWVMGSIGDGLEIFDGQSGSPVTKLPQDGIFRYLVPSRDLALSSYIKAVNLKVEKGFHVFDIQRKKVTAALLTDGTSVRAFTPDGRIFVTVNDKGAMYVFDLTQLQ